MEITPVEYVEHGHWARWKVIELLTTNGPPYSFNWITDEHKAWAAENCKSRYCHVAGRMMAFESRKEALMFKMVFV